MALPTTTIVGNVVADPELRFTPSNAAVVSFRVAAGERKKDDQGNWVDGDTTFLSVSAWRQLAENVADQVKKGTGVIVTGRLKQRSYDKADGTKVTVVELEADEVGIQIRKSAPRGVVYQAPANDAWNDGTDPWATKAPTQSDEVPF
jgi:single-strand DNA-binding protein